MPALDAHREALREGRVRVSVFHPLGRQWCINALSWFFNQASNLSQLTGPVINLSFSNVWPWSSAGKLQNSQYCSCGVPSGPASGNMWESMGVQGRVAQDVGGLRQDSLCLPRLPMPADTYPHLPMPACTCAHLPLPATPANTCYICSPTGRAAHRHGWASVASKAHPQGTLYINSECDQNF